MQIRDYVQSQKPAVILAASGTVIGFDELEECANRLAQHWRSAGLRHGDTVAAIMENNEHVHAVMWAARRSGLYYALVNTHLTPAEAAYIVDNSGAKAIIGTITPFGGSMSHSSPEKERTRQAVNAWIRTSGEPDGVADFDLAIRDRADPSRMQAAFDSGDHLHPNEAGEKAMGDAVNLALFD